MTLTKATYSMINGACANVKDFGAVGDGVTDDTIAIQAAIDHMFSTYGGGGVYIPVGQYIVTQIKLKNKIALFGDGWHSRITLKDNTDDHLIVLDNINVEWTRLSNLMVDGNRFENASGDAIHYDNTGGTFTFFDPNHIIENILIYTAAGAGLSLSVDCRESKVVNVFCTGANGDAFYISATDSTFVNCTSGAAGLNGWNILGPNNRFTGCKAFGSARLVSSGGFDGAGFRIAQPRNMLTTCEAQDNGWHGFLFLNANNCISSSLVADSNGTNTTGSAGIRVDNSDKCLIQAITLNRDAGTSQKYALSFGNSPANNIINLTSFNNADGAFTDSVGDNIVVINNLQVLNTSAPVVDVNAALSWYLASDTQLNIVVRGSDGVTRSSTLTLS